MAACNRLLSVGRSVFFRSGYSAFRSLLGQFIDCGPLQDLCCRITSAVLKSYEVNHSDGIAVRGEQLQIMRTDDPRFTQIFKKRFKCVAAFYFLTVLSCVPDNRELFWEHLLYTGVSLLFMGVSVVAGVLLWKLYFRAKVDPAASISGMLLLSVHYVLALAGWFGAIFFDRFFPGEAHGLIPDMFVVGPKLYLLVFSTASFLEKLITELTDDPKFTQIFKKRSKFVLFFYYATVLFCIPYNRELFWEHLLYTSVSLLFMGVSVVAGFLLWKLYFRAKIDPAASTWGMFLLSVHHVLALAGFGAIFFDRFFPGEAYGLITALFVIVPVLYLSQCVESLLQWLVVCLLC